MSAIGTLVFVGLDHVAVDSDFVHLVFDGFGRRRVGLGNSHQGAEPCHSEQYPEERAKYGGSLLSRWGEPDSPCDARSPDTVGQVEHASDHPDGIDQGPKESKAFHRFGQGTCGVVRTELSHPQRFDKSEPPVPMEPTVEV